MHDQLKPLSSFFHPPPFSAIFFHKTAEIHFFFEIYFYTSSCTCVEKKERETGRETERKENRENEVEICIEMTGAGFNEKYMSAPPRKLRYRGKL